MRIACARLSHETHGLSPLETRLDAFERFHLFEGESLALRLRPTRREAPGLLWSAELSGLWAAATREGVELVPLVSAWALPGGPLSADTFEHLLGRLLDGLREAGPVDGVFLVLHGAMGVTGVPDPDSAIVEAVRAVVGPGVPIAVVLDLHAIVTARMVAAADLLFGYRTNPHRDQARTGYRAARALFRAVRGGIRPTTAWRWLPMVIGGAPGVDLLAPMRAIFARLRALDADPRVVGCSVFQAQLWSLAPHGAWSCVVHTDGDPALAERLADELADALWATRQDTPDDLVDPSEAIRRVRAAPWWRRRLGNVCMVDASDAVGCGSVGENTAILDALLREGQGLLSYVAVRGTSLVDRYWGAPPGAPVRHPVGGEAAPGWSAPLELTGRLAGSARTAVSGRAVVVDCGHVRVVVTESAPMALGPGFYRDMGLAPLAADVLVVKSLFLFRLYALAHNRMSVFVRTRGMTDLDSWRRAAYDQPVWPRDRLEDWRDGDRLRRFGPAASQLAAK